MKHATNCISLFLGGALVGAAVALLFAPKKGSEMRRDIRDLANKGTRKLKDEIDRIHCECEGLDCDCDRND